MPEGVNAVDASTALSRFCNGEGLFFPSGNWNLDTVAKALGDDVQFFAFPVPPVKMSRTLLLMQVHFMVFR